MKSNQISELQFINKPRCTFRVGIVFENPFTLSKLIRHYVDLAVKVLPSVPLQSLQSVITVI